jgi:hypothetical protein
MNDKEALSPECCVCLRRKEQWFYVPVRNPRGRTLQRFICAECAPQLVDVLSGGAQQPVPVPA